MYVLKIKIVQIGFGENFVSPGDEGFAGITFYLPSLVQHYQRTLPYESRNTWQKLG